MILELKKPLSFKTSEAEIKRLRKIVHDAAERLGEMINPEMPMIGRRFNISTGLANATVEHVEYDASKLFEFIGYTLVDCDVQAEELEDGIKDLIKRHFAHIKLAKAIAASEEGILTEEGMQSKMKGGQNG